MSSRNDAVNQVINLAAKKRGAYVCVSNVHMCMETLDSVGFRSIVNDADLVIPDGRPIFFAQKILGAAGASQVRGQDIMNDICKMSGRNKLNVGLYGGSSIEVLESTAEELQGKFPDINITYKYSPPFRALSEKEDERVVEELISQGVNVLFVGIGCPKQEQWMAEHKGRVNCVMLGVGAAFDFISGSKKRAPVWMQKAGLEWFSRLLSEPRRLWKRYLKQNPRFIFHFGRQIFFGKNY
ncbi:WecB/TagA/CpsF family glycosyltransferase [Microbulbifer sp. SAOS-129_SWC]|uniref:WecB/TagA/CpsF family glycosyltransferase n=1 Tax=Microbulbifer sp. SAOS-129_SWC TaxID=3145235 RepID=UPI0032170F4C